MATLTFERKEIEKYIKVNEEMADKSTMMGVPAEIKDGQVILEVTPNRPDLLSMQGFLRTFKSFTGKEPGLKKYKIEKSGHKLIIDKLLPKEWPYAVSCIVKGLKFDDSKIKEVIDIQEKLGLTLCRKRKKGGIGIYPLEKISFPIKFKGMLAEEIKFRPLEFPEIITGRQILSKHPTGREYAHLTEGWDKLPVFIDNKGIIMSMPPIINSHNVGKIDATTKDVFIESSGPDLNTIKKAIIIIATALADMGGKIYSIECVQQNGEKEDIPNMESEKMKINLENTNRLLGLQLKEKDLDNLLPKMGYDYKKGEVMVPPWRLDVLHEVDIIEDIAIAYGYDNIIPEIPKVSTVGAESNKSKISRKIAEILTGLGIIEISSYHLIKDEDASRYELRANKIEVENSKTDYKILRPNLIIPAFRVFAENKDNEYPQRIFELGKVFGKDNSDRSEIGVIENDRLIIACSPSDFTELKKITDYLMKMLGIKYELKESVKKELIEGRTGALIVNKREIGIIGEVHPETLRKWSIKMPVSLLEINIEGLFG